MKNLRTKLSYTLYILLAVVPLVSCEPTRQYVYEGNGLIVTGKKIGDKPERGKFIYYVNDQDGKVTIWSDTDFKVGDTLKLAPYYR